MFVYKWDEETGGLLLEARPSLLSNEPRPVYSQELDLLGFNKFWKYTPNNDVPYMWNEAGAYYYRGRKVAKTKGGTLLQAPSIVLLEDPEPEGKELIPVDIEAMVAKNQDIIQSLVQKTLQDIYATYQKYKSKISIFYVAFSGGKDSIVTLDLVQQALPHHLFKVLFSDTGMESSDTYEAVRIIDEQCKQTGIDFLTVSAEQDPRETWNKFGPPASVNRWCCNVHKTTPQILALRKLTKNPRFTGMAFVGVRASESVARSKYEMVSVGTKHQGQYSCNPILDWNSAELFIYMYSAKLLMNEAYKKGNKRVGCLVCPKASTRNEWISYQCYKKETDVFLNNIRFQYKDHFPSAVQLDEFIGNGGWKARKNGRDLPWPVNYEEREEDDDIVITLPEHAHTSWKQWMKTVGTVLTIDSPYIIRFRKERYDFTVTDLPSGGLEVRIKSAIAKENPTFIKLFKNVFRKAGCCVTCRECEVDCPYGHISMGPEGVVISDNCIQCQKCHKPPKGCLVFKSLEKPKGMKAMPLKSLNRYSHHAPEDISPILQYINSPDTFVEETELSATKIQWFKCFLRDAGLLEKSKPTACLKLLADKMKSEENCSAEDSKIWPVLLVNLSFSSQFEWFLKNCEIDKEYSREWFNEALADQVSSTSVLTDIWSCLSRFTKMPFNNCGLGNMSRKKVGKKEVALSYTRTAWTNPNPVVVLYALYKYSEANGNLRQFSIDELVQPSEESNGVSPCELFGISAESLRAMMSGLERRHDYPFNELISTKFTLDLNYLLLAESKTSFDVLECL